MDGTSCIIDIFESSFLYSRKLSLDDLEGKSGFSIPQLPDFIIECPLEDINCDLTDFITGINGELPTSIGTIVELKFDGRDPFEAFTGIGEMFEYITGKIGAPF